MPANQVIMKVCDFLQTPPLYEEIEGVLRTPQDITHVLEVREKKSSIRLSYMPKDDRASHYRVIAVTT